MTKYIKMAKIKYSISFIGCIEETNCIVTFVETVEDILTSTTA